MIVQFQRNFPPYNAEERAEFAGPAARRFIEQGIARAVVTAGEAVQKEEEVDDPVASMFVGDSAPESEDAPQKPKRKSKPE